MVSIKREREPEVDDDDAEESRKCNSQRFRHSELLLPEQHNIIIKPLSSFALFVPSRNGNIS